MHSYSITTQVWAAQNGLRRIKYKNYLGECILKYVTPKQLDTFKKKGTSFCEI
jgi:hypothetical protein